MEKPHIRVVVAEIERDGRFLITRRRPEAHLPLLWEFPGGRVEGEEPDQLALARELREKIGAEVTVGELSLQVRHEYEGYTLDLLVYRGTATTEPVAKRVHEIRWVLAEELDQYEFPGADQQTVDALLR